MPQNLAQLPPQFFQRNLGTVVLLLVDVIGSILISLSRCCLPNDEGPGPQYFFLEPPLEATIILTDCTELLSEKCTDRPVDSTCC